jgi:hypothetical protein
VEHSIQIIDGNNPRGWYAYLDRLPKADVYYTPHYYAVYERNGEGIAQLFLYCEGDVFVYYPYLLRRISDLPSVQAAGIERELFDISTPYGYGGPVTNVEDPAERGPLFRRFERAFHAYCARKGIVTEFVRFHPLLENYKDYKAVQPIFVRNTAYIDLAGSENDITESYSRDNHNRLRRAIKEGLQVAFKDPMNTGNLQDLFRATMEKKKKKADDYDFFNESFFRSTTQLLKGNIQLVEVTRGERTIASALFMHYGDFMHYHLMGSDKEYLLVAPENLLLHHAAVWAQKQGFRYLHLGGGYTGDDNLFRFKSSFNERTAADFYIGKSVHCPQIYASLVSGLDDVETSGYFPAYRLTAHSKPTGIAKLY